MIIPECKYLDIYDGKSNFGFFLFKLALTGATFLVFTKDDKLYHIVYIAIFLLFIVIVFLARFVSTVHYSSVGAYFELAPLFSTPFLLIFEIYVTNQWYCCLFFIILIHILLIIILNIQRKYLTRETKRVFDSLIHRNRQNEADSDPTTQGNSTADIPSFVSGLRIIGQLHGDPAFFIKFAANQHRSGQKVRASAMIEVVRFLGLFPSKREEMIYELENLQSKSNYNRFTIYILRKVLKSLVSNCSDKKISKIEHIQQSFIIHHHLYWLSRSQNRFFNAFKESLSAVYDYGTLKLELFALLNRYPYDYHLLKIYNNFLLLGFGDFKAFALFDSYLRNLDKKIVPIVDPILHKIVEINPRIMSFLTIEERKSTQVLNYMKPFQRRFYTTTNRTMTDISTNETNSTHNSIRKNSIIRSHRNNSVNLYSINTNSSSNTRDPAVYIEEKEMIASYVQSSNRCMPLFFIIHLLITTFLISFFLFYSIKLKEDTIQELDEIVAYKEILIRSYQMVSTSLFIPLSVLFQNQIHAGIEPKTGLDSSHYMIKNKYVTDNSYVTKNLSEKIKIYKNFYQPNRIINQHIYHSKSTQFNFFNKRITKLRPINDCSHYSNIEPKDIYDINLTDMTNNECQVYFDSIYYQILDFFALIPELYNAKYYLITLTSDLSKRIILEGADACEMVSVLFKYCYGIHLDFWQPFLNNLNESLEKVVYFGENQPMDGYLERYALSVFIAILVCILIYFIITMVQINVIFKGETNAISFLSSKERLTSLLYGEIIESWESLINYIPKLSKILKISDSSPVQKNSEVNTDFLTTNSTKSENPYDTCSAKSSHLNVQLKDDKHSSDDISMSSLEEEEDLSEIIDRTVIKTQKENRFKWIILTLLLIAPVILLFFIIGIFTSPLTKSIRTYNEIVELTKAKQWKFEMSVNLVGHAFNQLTGYEVTSEQYQEVHNALINNSETEITQLYYREQCLQLLGITCTSISALVDELIKNECDENRILFLSLPAFLTFSQGILRDILYTGLENGKKANIQSEISYCACIVVVVLYLFINYYFMNNNLLHEGFNSLFHYPTNFLMDNLNEKSTSNINLPTAVISVSSLAKTGEIYSISDNPAFNKSPTSFIGEKFDKVFPIVSSGNDYEIREFVLTDKTTKKTFRASTKVKNRGIISTLMIEDINMHSKKTYKDETITQKLMNFIPVYYAKLFGEKYIHSYKYNNSILVFVRCDSTLQSQIMEQYFSVLNTTMMNFSSIKQIFVLGSIFIFATIKEVNPIIPFLFARDLIIESISPKRGKATNGTYSIFIDYIAELEVEINQNDEPYIETNIPYEEHKIDTLFLCPRNRVYINSSIENIINGITQNGHSTKEDNMSQFQSVSFSFEEYLSHLDPFL